MLAKIKKLKGRNFTEIRERGRQGANVLAERIGLSVQTRLPTNAQLLGKFQIHDKSISAENLLEYFRSRENVKFYASFEKSEATINELRKRFPAEEAAIVNRADRICKGFFDLLGYENLYFASDIPNWHFDPISQKTSPRVHWSQIEEINASQTGDKKIIWELNRHQYFTTLGRAFWLTKNAKYAQTLVAHLESWFAQNPPKIGVNWLSSLEIAFRSISWIWAFHFFKDSPNLTSEVFLQMLKYLYLNGRHLETYLSTYFSPNTHLTGEALGLYFLGTFLPELQEAKRWKDLGYRILLDALDFQVRADGVYCEQANHYHRYTTDFYANLMILRQLAGDSIDHKHQHKLNQLFEFLLFITEPRGETALFGDDDGGRFYFLDERVLTDFRPTLAVGATLFKRGDFKFVAREPSAELLWLLGVEGLRQFDDLEAFEPKETSKTFDTSGFFVMRNSWSEDANFLLIDCGEHGFLNCGHAHADALSFSLCSDGEPIFIDSGTYNYTSDRAARDVFRSTAAHNCLSVNGESSSIPDGAFSWKSIAHAQMLEWREDADTVYFRGTHNGFKRFGVKYEREIIMQKSGSIFVNDLITSDMTNTYQVNFILSPHLAAEIQNKSTIIFDWKNREQPRLIVDAEITAQNLSKEDFWKIEPCSVSTRYGNRIESKKIVLTVINKGNLQIRSVFRKVKK